MVNQVNSLNNINDIQWQIGNIPKNTSSKSTSLFLERVKSQETANATSLSNIIDKTAKPKTRAEIILDLAGPKFVSLLTDYGCLLKEDLICLTANELVNLAYLTFLVKLISQDSKEKCFGFLRFLNKKPWLDQNTNEQKKLWNAFKIEVGKFIPNHSDNIEIFDAICRVASLVPKESKEPKDLSKETSQRLCEHWIFLNKNLKPLIQSKWDLFVELAQNRTTIAPFSEIFKIKYKNKNHNIYLHKWLKGSHVGINRWLDKIDTFLINPSQNTANEIVDYEESLKNCAELIQAAGLKVRGWQFVINDCLNNENELSTELKTHFKMCAETFGKLWSHYIRDLFEYSIKHGPDCEKEILKNTCNLMSLNFDHLKPRRDSKYGQQLFVALRTFVMQMQAEHVIFVDKKLRSQNLDRLEKKYYWGNLNEIPNDTRKLASFCIQGLRKICDSCFMIEHELFQKFEDDLLGVPKLSVFLWLMHMIIVAKLSSSKFKLLSPHGQIPVMMTVIGCQLLEYKNSVGDWLQCGKNDLKPAKGKENSIVLEGVPVTEVAGDHASKFYDNEQFLTEWIHLYTDSLLPILKRCLEQEDKVLYQIFNDQFENEGETLTVEKSAQITPKEDSKEEVQTKPQKIEANLVSISKQIHQKTTCPFSNSLSSEVHSFRTKIAKTYEIANVTPGALSEEIVSIKSIHCFEHLDHLLHLQMISEMLPAAMSVNTAISYKRAISLQFILWSFLSMEQAITVQYALRDLKFDSKKHQLDYLLSGIDPSLNLRAKKWQALLNSGTKAIRFSSYYQSFFNSQSIIQEAPHLLTEALELQASLIDKKHKLATTYTFPENKHKLLPDEELRKKAGAIENELLQVIAILKQQNDLNRVVVLGNAYSLLHNITDALELMNAYSQQRYLYTHARTLTIFIRNLLENIKLFYWIDYERRNGGLMMHFSHSLSKYTGYGLGKNLNEEELKLIQEIDLRKGDEYFYTYFKRLKEMDQKPTALAKYLDQLSNYSMAAIEVGEGADPFFFPKRDQQDLHNELKQKIVGYLDLIAKIISNLSV